MKSFKSNLMKVLASSRSVFSNRVISFTPTHPFCLYEELAMGAFPTSCKNSLNIFQAKSNRTKAQHLGMMEGTEIESIQSFFDKHQNLVGSGLI